MTRTLRIVSALAAAVGLVVVGAGSAPGAATPLSWSAPLAIDHGPPVGPDHRTRFWAVSCPTTSLCVAVDDAGQILTSADPADGTAATWQIKVVADKAIYGVSCPSASLCVAAGSDGNLLMSTDPGDGRSASWTVEHVPGASTSGVNGVSCPSSSLCVAVDADGNVLATTDPADGASATWTVKNVNGTKPINWISCPSSSLCVAVDGLGEVLTSTDAGGGASATWTIKDVDGTGDIDSISCGSAALCVAVDTAGNTITSTDPADRASATWSVHQLDPGAALYDISCHSPSFCFAVDDHGRTFASGDPVSGTWAVMKAEGIPIDAVSCPAASLCVAGADNGDVVTWRNPSGSASPSWRTASIGTSELPRDVSCPSSTLCVAVASGGDVATTTDPADGASAVWTVKSLDPNPDPNFPLDLRGVSCASTTLCVAVSGFKVFTSTNPAAGASATWSAADPNPDTSHLQLTGMGLAGVSCPTSSLCVAVGQVFDKDLGQSFGAAVTSTDPADGAAATWTIKKLGAAGSTASAVSCPSPSLCVAVAGFADTILTSTDPADGAAATWTVKTITGNSFSDVSCPSTSFCIAGGDPSVVTTDPADGAAADWRTTGARLDRVSCPSTTLCVGLGRSTDLSGFSDGLVASSDPADGPSATWTTTTGVPFTFDVTCAGLSLCVAVGNPGGGAVALTSTNPAAGSLASAEKVAVDGTNALGPVACPGAGLCVAGDDQGNVVTSTDPANAASWSSRTVAPPLAGHPLTQNYWKIGAVACPSHSLCLAGSGSTVFTTSDPADGASAAWVAKDVGAARGLSCPTTSLCVAVGGGNIATSSDPGDGASATWTLKTIPNASLVSVSCASTSLCVAAGADKVFISTNPGAGASATWSVTTVAAGLRGVSCPSASLCVAVAGGNVATSTDPANGAAATWALKSVDSGSELSAVSCAPTPCVAVDISGNVFTSTDPADGAAATWATKPVETGPSAGFLGVSCASPLLCVAVDFGGNAVASTDPGDGGSATWTLKRVTFRILRGVSCPDVGFCVAVGDGGFAFTSSDPGDGASANWTARNAVRASHASGFVLDLEPSPLAALACPSQLLCVGADRNGRIFTTTDPADGASATWATKDLSAYSDGPVALSCPSASLCVAIGWSNGPPVFVATSTDPGDGSSATWTFKELPTESEPVDISCASASLCVAVDADSDVITSTDPADGASATWTVKLVAGLSGLSGVSCPSTSLCVAGGRKSRVHSSFVSLDPVAVTSTNPAAGAAANWTVKFFEATPTDTSDFNIGDVSCPSASLCVVAGDEGNVVASTDPADAGSAAWAVTQIDPGHTVADVACATASLCAAVDGAGRAMIGTGAATAQHTLSVGLAGTGAGTVTGNGISCPGTCTHGYPAGTAITLTAIPAAGSSFAHWGGACSGVGTCTVTLDADTSVSATFDRVNRAPVAADGTLATDEGTPATVTLQASDPDGDALTYSVVNGPGHGTLGGSGAIRTYTPATGYSGSDSFTFKANDGSLDSNPATVSITVRHVNHAPVAANGTVATDQDTAVGVTLQGTDPDGDALTYSVVNAPGHGTLSGSGANRTYTPAAGYSGSDSFTFKANDGQLDSNVATVSITVRAVLVQPGECLICILGSVGRTNLRSSGVGSITAARGSIFINGAAAVSGAGKIKATAIKMYPRAASGRNWSPQPTALAAPVVDPLASLAAVSSSGACKKPKLDKPSSALAPGVYCKLALTGRARLVLEPGLYVIRNGIDLSGRASIRGTNVTLYLAGSASVRVSGESTLDLSAPGKGKLESIGMFFDRRDAGALTVSGRAAATVDGAIYGRAATLRLSGSAVVKCVGGPIAVRALTRSGGSKVVARSG